MVKGVKNTKDSVNWSFDYKKIRILNYLYANGQGAIRSTFLNLPRLEFIGAISPSEIDLLLQELIYEELILRNEYTRRVVTYTITMKGKQLIDLLKQLQTNPKSRFFILRALDEPTDPVVSRNDFL